MQIVDNPWRGRVILPEVPLPGTGAQAPLVLLARCPVASETPLLTLGALGGAGEVLAKDERGRMGLGSFKALGAAYVIAHQAERAGGRLPGRCFVAASAGNHGLSVAAGARVFGARSVIYLSETVPESFADRLRAEGAEVVREGDDYEASMAAAARAAEDEGWTLLSDSSWPGYFDLPHRLMEGYLAMADEIVRQVPAPPDLILLQAGVGGLAGACAALFREAWGEGPVIGVVEPEAAPALQASIRAGRAVAAPGPVSCMGRLDCKEPSLIALNGLARDADLFITISEDEARAVLPVLAGKGAATTASGGAGAAALLADGPGLGAGPGTRALAILSEAPE